MIKRIINKSRKILRNIYLSVMGRIVAPQPYVAILSGHMVDWNHDSDADGARFLDLLQALKRKCDFVDFQDAVKMITENAVVQRPTIAFAFDDGWRDCYSQIAPQLETMGVNAAFFVNPHFADAADNEDVDYIENFTDNVTKSPGKFPMTWSQIKDLNKRGFIIGAHTLDHYCINDDNIQELLHQIVDCKSAIEKRLGTPCEYFAFPYGRLEHANQESIDIACKHYKYVFSQGDYKHYFSYGGKVINRRHFEPFWPISHVMYFLSKKRS